MKKLLIALIALITVFAADAQTALRSNKDSLVNTDTTILTFAGVGSKVKGLQATAIKVSGTVSAKIYYQGTIDGIEWVNIDSLSLTDVATYQTKVVPVTATTYSSYRSKCITSGTQKFYTWFSLIRRPDE